MKIFSVLATTAALLSCGASGWKLRLFEEKNFLGKSIAFQGKTKIGTSGCMKLEYNDKGKIGKLKGVSSIWFSDEYKAKTKSIVPFGTTTTTRNAKLRDSPTPPPRTVLIITSHFASRKPPIWCSVTNMTPVLTVHSQGDRGQLSQLASARPPS
jgi:hypothetical protein